MDDRATNGSDAAPAPQDVDVTSAVGDGPEGSHAPARPVLTRDADSGIVAGVAAALGTYLRVDVAILRVAFVVLSFFGGMGVLLYLAGWLLIPPPTDRRSIGERALGSSQKAPSWLRVVLLLVGIAWFVNALGPWRSTVGWALGLIGVGVILYRQGADDGGGAPSPAPAPPEGALGAAATVPPPPESSSALPPGAPPPSEALSTPRPSPGRSSARVGPPGLHMPGSATPAAVSMRAATVPPQRPAASQRPRSTLWQVIVALALVALGVAAVLHTSGVLTLPLYAYPGLVLLVLGAGLVVGAWWGRARWLILVGVLLVPWLLAASVVRPPLAGGVGQPRWHPTSLEALQPEYRLAAGRMALDLSDLPVGTDPVAVSASVAVGDLDVIVAEGAAVEIDGDVGAGAIRAFGGTSTGAPLSRTISERPTASGGLIELDLDVGVGEIRIRRAVD